MDLESNILSGIIQGTSDLIAALDLKYKFIAFNSAYQEEFKRLFNKDITLGMSLTEALENCPADKTNVVKMWKRALSEDNFSLVSQFGSNGSSRFYEVTYSALWEGNKRIGASQIARDVTNRLKAEKALREREERYHLLSRSTNDAIYEWDLINGKFWWNDAIYNLFGYTLKDVELEVNWWVQKVHEKDREALLKSIKDKINGEISFWSHEYKFQKADKNYATIYDRGYVVYNESWEPLRIIGTMTDITERKNAEEALIQREAKFRSLLKNSSDIISIINPACQFMYTSPSVEKILGYRPEELVGQYRENFIHLEDLSIVNSTIAKLLDNPGEHITVQNRFKHKNGEYVMLESTYNNLISDPSVMGIVVNSRDINERMAAQNALRHSEAVLKESQRIAQMGNWEYDVEKGKMHWSDELFYVMKRSQSEGEPTFDELLSSLLPADSLLLKDAFTKAVEKGIPYNIDNGRIVNGKIQFLNTICNPVVNWEGKVSKLRGIIIDITSRKEAEERLLESEQWFKTIFNASRDGFVVELNENIFYVNEALVQLFGYESQEEILGASITSLIAEADAQMLSKYSKKRLKGEVVPSIYEAQGKRKDGIIIEIEISASVFSIKESNYIISLIRDITERKQAEKKLMEQNEELKKINSELDRFVYSASHDLRAPLVSVLGLTNVLKLNETDSEKIRYLDLVAKSINKLDRFIQEIIHHSRNSRIEIKSEEVEFKRIIDDTFEDLKYLDGAESFKINIDIRAKTKFYSDPSRISVVFNNLISNAIRYSCPHLRVPSINIVVTITKDKAKIRIVDNGQGIGEEHVDRIFEMFYRASQKNVGSGLGLYIVKETILKLEGAIQVYSKLDEGTTFEIVLPNRYPPKAIKD